MAPFGDRKRKADDSPAVEPIGPSPMSPVLRAPLVPTVRPSVPRTTPGVWPITNRYYYDNCKVLYEQNVEHLNAQFQQLLQENPAINDCYWYCNEYLRRIMKLKDLYQKPFVGYVFTCGMSDMESLGYGMNTTAPKIVRSLKNSNVVAISCGSTYTVMLTRDGRVLTFGSQDEGGMGREGEASEGDMQVRGFIPSKQASWTTPVANEDGCMIKVAGGYAKTLFLSIHKNLYSSGCFRDYDDSKIREKPDDINELDKDGKKFPKGANYAPVHLYEMPGKVKDMACGTFMNAAILDNGEVVTWGVGTMGELGRPVPDAIRDTVTGKHHNDLLEKVFLKPQVPPKIKGKVALSIACGQGHFVAVVREPGHLESTVYASGLNKNGQLGLGDLVDRKELTPLDYTKEMMIAEVQAGNFHTLALTLDRRKVFACGQNDYGQCGLSDEKPAHDATVLTLQPVSFPTDDLEFDQIACGEHHNLAIAKPTGGTREVYTWGSSVALEGACTLGHGEDDKNEYRPRKLVLKKTDGSKAPEGGVWRQVSGGTQHSAFLRTSAPKEAAVAQPARRVLRKIGP